jgi:hypothetical protein
MDGRSPSLPWNHRLPISLRPGRMPDARICVAGQFPSVPMEPASGAFPCESASWSRPTSDENSCRDTEYP